MISNILAKIADAVKNHQKDIFLGFCIILISIIGFNLGKLNALNKTPTQTDEKATIYLTPAGTPVSGTPKPLNTKYRIPNTDPRVVASKASTSKKYHFTWCPGAKKIKEANKLWFTNESLAQKAGYTLAGNCQ